ncbi:hypothetical protein ACLIA0_04630 [Bacillaceae bacterium W0354]
MDELKIKEALKQHVFTNKGISHSSKEQVLERIRRKRLINRSIGPMVLTIMALVIFVISVTSLWIEDDKLYQLLPESTLGSFFDREEINLLVATEEVEIFRASSIDFFNEQIGWVSISGHLMKTENGGSDWEIKYKTDEIYQIEVVNEEVVYAITYVREQGTKNLIKTADGGENWTVVSNLNFKDVYYERDEGFMHFISEQEGFIANYYTSDGGNTWNTLSIPEHTVNYPYFLNKQVGWAIQYDGNEIIVAKTENGGETWEIKTTFHSQSPVFNTIIRSTSQDSVWVLLEGDSAMQKTAYTLIHTKNDGDNWVSIVNHLFDPLNISPDSESEIVEKGYSNDALRQGELHVLSDTTAILGGYCPACEDTNGVGWTNDSGNTWQVSDQKFAGYSPLKYSFLNEQVGWLITSGGENQPILYQTIDGGRSWNETYEFSQIK